MAQEDEIIRKIAEAMNDLQNPLIRFRENLENLSEEEKKAAISAKKLGEGANLAVSSVMQLAKAAANTASELYNGKKGGAAFNGALDGMGGAVKSGTKAIATMVPAMKGAAIAFSLVTQAALAYAKAANVMADGLYKGYQGLSKSGAAASDGMTGLYNDSKKLGLSMSELDGYVQLIGENSKDLAMFGGTVYKGRQQFADLNKALEGPVRTGLMNLGMSVQDIADGTMGYLKLQTRLGRAQNMTNEQLADGAARYLREQDALAKVTGQSRKEMEDATERAMMGEQFAAKVRQLEMSGQQEAADKLIELNKIYGAAGPKVQAGFQAIVTGNLSNKDAQDLYRASQGEALASTQRVIAGQQDVADAAQGTFKQLGKTSDQLGTTLGQVGAYDKNFGPMYEHQRARILAEGNLADNLKKAQKEQEAQGAKGGAHADKMVSNQTTLIETQIKINHALQDFVKDGILPAQKAMQKLADIALGGATAAKDMGPKGAVGLAGTAAGAYGGAKVGMMVGALGGPIGMAIGAALGGIAGGMLGKGAADAGSDAIGLPGRSTGSLGATNKLIEDFGKGTPVMLHGREGVITEKQLQAFGSSAMAAGLAAQQSKGGANPSSVGSGRSGVLGQPDHQIRKLVDETRRALDKQVTAEELILASKTEFYDFLVKQMDSIELSTMQEKKISAEDLKTVKDFSTKRDQLLDDILNNIKQQANTTAETTGIMGGGGGSTGGGGGGGGGSSTGGGGGGGSGSSTGGGGGGPMDFSTPSGNVVGRLLEYIGKKESNGNYNILVGGKTESNLTNMTVAEVLEYQRGMRQRGHESTAVGKYQIIKGTLESLIKEGYASPSDKFNASIQDRLATGLLKRRGLEKYQSGKLSKDQFADNLSKEWASLPYNTGQSYYAGVGSNKSSGSRDQFMTAFARNGGVFAGPDSGYPATLHGPEAVVPLPDGKTIPVRLENDSVFGKQNNIKDEMKQMMSEFKTAMQGMVEQMNNKAVLNAMDEMVKTQKASVDIQKKMLQAQS